MKKIHIAEDEVEIAQLLSAFFRRRGYQVSLSRTAQEAINNIQADVPDFAILDLFLEGDKSGLDILKFIKEKFPSIRTIVASGIMDDPMQDMMKGNEPDVYMKKPYSLEDLSKTIEKFC